MTKKELLKSYLVNLFEFAGFRLIKATGLLILSGIFQGFSLLILIPLLSLTGLSDLSAKNDSFSLAIQGLLGTLNISFNLTVILGLFFFLVVSEAVFNRYRSIVLSYLNLDYTNHIRQELYQKIGGANWEFHSRNHSSESMNLLDNAVDQIGDGTYYLLQVFVFISQSIVFLLVASSLSLTMTCVMLFTAIVLFILMKPVNNKVFNYSEKALQTNQLLYRNIVDFFGGLKLAKSFNRTDHHIKEFRATAETLVIDEKTVVRLSTSAQMYLRILSVFMLCLFVFVALEIFHMSIERLLVFIVLVNRLYSVFSSGQNHWQALLQCLPSFDVYNKSIKQFNMHQENLQNMEEIIPPIQIGIRLEDISFTYRGNDNLEVLSNLSLSFPAKKTTAIIGESGVGKSTLADILTGLLLPQSGKMYVDNKEIKPELLSNWRSHISYVSQDVYLFDGSIRSNIQWISDQKIDDEQIWLALNTAAAEDFVRKLPNQLDTLVGERGVKLSGGEKQRIALARAIIKKPDLLILDEATSSLDYKNEDKIRDALKNIQGSMMIIIIAHRDNMIRYADVVLELKDSQSSYRN